MYIYIPRMQTGEGEWNLYIYTSIHTYIYIQTHIFLSFSLSVLTKTCVVAVCCSVLQCLAVSCSVLQCLSVCCSVLQPPWRLTCTLTPLQFKLIRTLNPLQTHMHLRLCIHFVRDPHAHTTPLKLICTLNLKTYIMHY